MNKEYILYKKNIPILQYEEDDAHYITSIKKVFNVLHLPPHLFSDGKPSAQNEYGLCQKLEDFFNNRIIPYTRKSFKELLSEMQVHSGEELAKKSFYLSLSDQYWVCPVSQMGKIWWDDINFFTNEYDTAIGLRLMTGSKAVNKNTSSHSPDNTTGGELPKRWVRKNGINYLEKAGTGTEQQEPLNEVLASEICRRLGIAHTPYTLEIRDENYFSICPDIADESTEMIPLASIYQDIPLKGGVKYEFPKLVSRCEMLKIPNSETDLLKIFLLDYIIANEDRHSYNISFLRNSDTLEWIGVAPVYDSGKSMFVNKLDFEINMTSSFRIGAKPFEENQAMQFKALPMEKLAGIIDFSSLSDISKWYKKFLAPLRRLPQEKKSALVAKLEERIQEAERLINQKQEAAQTQALHGKDLFVSEQTPKYAVSTSDLAEQKFTAKHGVQSDGKNISAPSRTGQKKIPSEELVYTALIQEPTQTKDELSLHLNISRATITRALQKLVAQGKIRRMGANKNGRWEIL